jgi:hypothetical protein
MKYKSEKGSDVQIAFGRQVVGKELGKFSFTDPEGNVCYLEDILGRIPELESEIATLRDILDRYQAISASSAKLMAAAIDSLSIHDRENSQAIEDLKQSLNDLKGIQEASK